MITGLGDGGAEAVLYQLCLADKSSSHVVISLMDDDKYGSLLTHANIKVYFLNMGPNRLSVARLTKLYSIIRKVRPDVVQTWMIHANLIGGIVSRLAGISNVVWGVHHTTIDKEESKLTFIIAKMNAIVSRIVPRKIIYCAEKSKLLQESIGYSRAKGIVVPNGYNISKFSPSDEDRITFREELGLGEKVFLIGHVGRYVPEKDYNNLIESIYFMKQQDMVFKVVLVGSDLDIANNKLFEMIKHHDLIMDFILLGRRNDIPVVMNGFDLLVLSSSSEAFPNVLNEAMACGTPCVTTDVGDSAVIVGDTGWVVPTNDHMSLANAITQAFDEKLLRSDQWNERKIACRNRVVVNFSLDTMIFNYHKIWETSLCVE